MYYSIMTEEQEHIIFQTLDELLKKYPNIDGYYQFNELHQGVYVELKNI